jgi:hypothetical protein
LGVLREQYGKEGTGDMKTRETRRTIIRGWMASKTDKQEAEEQMKKKALAILCTIRLGTRNCRSFLQAFLSVPDYQAVLRQKHAVANS